MQQLNETRPGLVASGIEHQRARSSLAKVNQRSTHLQHVQQCGLAGIVQTEEEKLSVLIEETQRGQDIVDYNSKKRN